MSNNLIHRGKIVKDAVVNSGIKISRLARNISKSRRFIYNMFEKESIPLHYVKMIGDAINYDFSNEIVELKKNTESHQENNYLINIWKEKYINLLEEHNILLKLHYGKQH